MSPLTRLAHVSSPRDGLEKNCLHRLRLRDDGPVAETKRLIRTRPAARARRQLGERPNVCIEWLLKVFPPSNGEDAEMAEQLFPFHDTTLYPSDLERCADEGWFSDNLLDFWIDLLRHERMRKPMANVAYLNPGAVLLFSYLDDIDELLEAFEGAGIRSAALVLCPVNDAADPNSPGGSHWGLLVAHKASGTLVYLDSSLPGNSSRARAIAPKLASVAGIHFSPSTLQCPAVPQQRNGFDCGVYVCAFAEYVVPRAASVDLELGGMHDCITPTFVSGLRRSIRHEIESRRSAASAAR